jgi:hypothetical protein
MFRIVILSQKDGVIILSQQMASKADAMKLPPTLRRRCIGLLLLLQIIKRSETHHVAFSLKFVRLKEGLDFEQHERAVMFCTFVRYIFSSYHILIY